jgi:coproporphyrinogen III oxidase
MKINFTYIQNLQDQIVAGLEAVEGQAKFKGRSLGTSEGGGGRTRIENGNVIEKAESIFQCTGKLPIRCKRCSM